jgi:hypothetical protein
LVATIFYSPGSARFTWPSSFPIKPSKARHQKQDIIAQKCSSHPTDRLFWEITNISGKNSNYPKSLLLLNKLKNLHSQRQQFLGANLETLKANYHANSWQLSMEGAFSFNVLELSTLNPKPWLDSYKDRWIC